MYVCMFVAMAGIDMLSLKTVGECEIKCTYKQSSKIRHVRFPKCGRDICTDCSTNNQCVCLSIYLHIAPYLLVHPAPMARDDLMKRISEYEAIVARAGESVRTVAQEQLRLWKRLLRCSPSGPMEAAATEVRRHDNCAYRFMACDVVIS
jgi:hypothetical protein